MRTGSPSGTPSPGSTGASPAGRRFSWSGAELERGWGPRGVPPRTYFALAPCAFRDMHDGPDPKNKLRLPGGHSFRVCREGLLFRQQRHRAPVVLLSFEHPPRRYVHDRAVGADGVELVRKTAWDLWAPAHVTSCVSPRDGGHGDSGHRDGGHGVPVEKRFSLDQAEFRAGGGKAGLKDHLGWTPGFFLAFLHIRNQTW